MIGRERIAQRRLENRREEWDRAIGSVGKKMDRKMDGRAGAKLREEKGEEEEVRSHWRQRTRRIRYQWNQ